MSYYQTLLSYFNFPMHAIQQQNFCLIVLSRLLFNPFKGSLSIRILTHYGEIWPVCISTQIQKCFCSVSKNKNTTGTVLQCPPCTTLFLLRAQQEQYCQTCLSSQETMQEQFYTVQVQNGTYRLIDSNYNVELQLIKTSPTDNILKCKFR